MDAITDPTVTQVSVMKSARVGYTKIMNATIGYYIHQDPCPIMVVQPTIEDAQGYSKEEIAPMLRDCRRRSPRLCRPKTRDSTTRSC
jgi:phage terminase large subunit GpA-like protein